MATSLDVFNAIAAVCPIIGLSVGDPTNKATWRIDYAPNATPTQQTAAQNALAVFNINAPSVPAFVSGMQAKVALSRAGLLTQVQNWVNTQSAETQLIWNNAQTFSRNSAIIASGAAALGLSQAQLDSLFATAITITP